MSAERRELTAENKCDRHLHGRWRQYCVNRRRETRSPAYGKDTEWAECAPGFQSK
jgi:hypothetical protein